MIQTQTRTQAPATAPKAGLFWLAVAVQVGLVVAVPTPKVLAYTTGTAIQLRTAPVDPVDLLRGRYNRLGYTVTQNMDKLPGWQASYGSARELYFTLAPGKPGEGWRAVAIADRYPASVPAGDVVLAGDQHGAVHFGIEEFYVPDDRGEAVTKALADPKGKPLADIKVDRWGHAVLVGLSAGGQHF